MAITRRDFLKISSATGAGVLFGVLDLKPVVAYAQANPPVWTSQALVQCPFCGVGCMTIVCANSAGQVTYVQGDPDSPVNQGTLCPKGHDFGEMNHIEGFVRPAHVPYLDSGGNPYKASNSQRIIHPLKRGPGATNWTIISWTQAINEIAQLIKDQRDADLIKTVDGGVLKSCRLESIGAYGSTKVSNEGCYLYTKLMRALGVVYIDHPART
jgi:formate dehydrogenase major subunit